MPKRTRTKIPADAVRVRNSVTGEAINVMQCKHHNQKHKVVAHASKSKRQHWQKFTWENCCADCGVVIKKGADKHK